MKGKKQLIYCPNGCGKRFKLDFKNKPKGMLAHLGECGRENMNILSELMEEVKKELEHV